MSEGSSNFLAFDSLGGVGILFLKGGELPNEMAFSCTS